VMEEIGENARRAAVRRGCGRAAPCSQVKP
jgi:hypothetical protein